MEYLLHILVLTGIYTTLAISLDLPVGHTGLLSIAQAAFFAVGAYTSALLAVTRGTSFLTGLFVGMVMGVLISFAVSLPSVRLHDDYFVIATFGFQMILFGALNNCASLTNGPLGIPGVPQPIVFGWKVLSHSGFLILTAAAASFALLVVRQFSMGPFGRVLHTIREDELFAKAHGKNTLRFKVVVFAVSAALAALAGSLYAHYITYIDPTSFTVMESILILSMVIIGGPGSLWGPLLGAVVLVTVPEALRFIGLPGSVAANFRQILYGVLLVIMMMFRPRGLVGRYGFGR